MIWTREKGPTVSFEVEGIRCTQCEATIKITLHHFKEVRNVKIQQKKNVQIEFLPGNQVSNTELFAAIEKTGYKVVTPVV
jgi:copper chaperone CopZ